MFSINHLCLFENFEVQYISQKRLYEITTYITNFYVNFLTYMHERINSTGYCLIDKASKVPTV